MRQDFAFLVKKQFKCMQCSCGRDDEFVKMRVCWSGSERLIKMTLCLVCCGPPDLDQDVKKAFIKGKEDL